MGLTLAVLEVGSLFGVVCLVLTLWAEPVLRYELESALLVQSLAVCACCAIAFYYNDLYDLRIVRGLRDYAPRLAQSLAVAFLLLAGCYAFVPDVRLSGPVFAGTLLLAAALVLPLRAVSYGIIMRRPLAQRVLILGTSPLAQKIAEEIETSPHLRYDVIGLVDDRNPDGAEPAEVAANGHPAIYRKLDHLSELVDELRPDCIVAALTERRGRLPVWGLLSSCAGGVRVVDGIDFYEKLTHKLAIESLSPSFLIFSGVLQKPRHQRAIRRAVNVVLALAGLVLTAPLMLAVAAAVKLDSPGPALFVQERAGLAGRRFRLLKFRTMREAPEEEPAGQDVWHRDDHSRITPLGHWLRRLRLDELPQFFNILRGDMDLIGPRPEMACNVKTMSELIPYYPLRHTVRPGVTGWAQINQGYSVTRAEVTEKMRYDLYYIKHMSVWLDLRILVDTVKIVLFGRGAQ